jgi:hypothetical protein
MVLVSRKATQFYLFDASMAIEQNFEVPLYVKNPVSESVIFALSSKYGSMKLTVHYLKSIIIYIKSTSYVLLFLTCAFGYLGISLAFLIG